MAADADFEYGVPRTEHKPEDDTEYDYGIPKSEFTYVLIPADESLPPQQFSTYATPCGDTLKEHLKKHFAGGTLTDLDSLRAEYGDKVVDEKEGDFQAVANRGSVEVQPLVRTSKTTLPEPNTATFMYYDEMGALKARPPNKRAFQLAAQCGVDLEHPLPGDVFIGRVCCDPGPINISIAVEELDSSAPWIKQAPAENQGWNDALKDFGNVAKAKAIGAKTAEEEEAENLSRCWRWQQTESDVELTVTVPEGTKKNDVHVAVKKNLVRVALKAKATDPLAEIKLFAAISVDDSTWTMGCDKSGPHVQITMEKDAEQTWPSIESKQRS